MEEIKKKVEEQGSLNGFSPVSSTPVFWKSRKRPEHFLHRELVESIDIVRGTCRAFVEKVRPDAFVETCSEVRFPQSHPEYSLIVCSSGQASSAKNLDTAIDESTADKAMEKQEDCSMEEKQQESNNFSVLSEKRKALFEPLEPVSGQRTSAESLLPPPDFESASYPKGWLIGKKRKLVNVDVVESMRRIAVQEINRKDREIDGLNEQLEEDARVLEHLQLQLLEERSKRTDVERQNTMLQDQITMLMNMLHENEPEEDDGPEEP